MTTLSLAYRVLDGGQLLPPAARWALHCLVVHKVIGVQYCILHLHQEHMDIGNRPSRLRSVDRGLD